MSVGKLVCELVTEKVEPGVDEISEVPVGEVDCEVVSEPVLGRELDDAEPEVELVAEVAELPVEGVPETGVESDMEVEADNVGEVLDSVAVEAEVVELEAGIGFGLGSELVGVVADAELKEEGEIVVSEVEIVDTEVEIVDTVVVGVMTEVAELTGAEPAGAVDEEGTALETVGVDSDEGAAGAEDCGPEVELGGGAAVEVGGSSIGITVSFVIGSLEEVVLGSCSEVAIEMVELWSVSNTGRGVDAGLFDML